MALKPKLTMPPTLKKMIDDFAEMERSGIDAVVVEMLDAGADVMLEGMQKRVPVDTGELKNHLGRGEVEQDGNVFGVEVGLIDAPKDVVIYGTVQEYGSKSVEAQSYIRETVARDKGKVYRSMREIMKTRLGDE